MNDRRSFRFLWIGQTFANSGDVFYIVGVISTLYISTGLVTLMALVPFIITVSRFTGGILAPLIIDRFKLKKILVFSQLGKTILLFVLAVYLTTGGIYLIFPIIGAIAFLDAWATPARNAMLPRLVGTEGLVKVNGFVSIVDSVVQLGGWPIAGILVATFSGQFLVAITLIFFLVSTCMMSLIKDKDDIKEDILLSSSKKWTSLKEGWLIIWKTPSLKTVAVIDLLDSISNVVWIAAILYIYVEEVLHKSEAWWGYINSTFFAGLIIGGLVSLKAEPTIKQRLDVTIIGGSFLVAIFTLWFGLTQIPWITLILSTLVGISSQIKSIGQITVVQLTSSERLLPKVFSARDAILSASFGFSSLIFGYMVDVFGVQTVFIIAALLLLLSSIWGYIRRVHLKLIQHRN